jgi:hypothetical protein
LPYFFTAHGHVLRIWEDLENNQCLHTIETEIEDDDDEDEEEEEDEEDENENLKYPKIRYLFPFQKGQSVCAISKNGLAKVWHAVSGALLYEIELAESSSEICLVLHTIIPNLSQDDCEMSDRNAHIDAVIIVYKDSIKVWQPVLPFKSEDDDKEEENQEHEDADDNTSHSEDIYDIEEDAEIASSITAIHQIHRYIYFGTDIGHVFKRSIDNLYDDIDETSIPSFETPISVIHHCMHFGIMIGNQSCRFEHHVGEEDTALYLPHRNLSIPLKDCLRHIFPLAHDMDLICTTGYTVENSYYDESDKKVFHPCLIWNMSRILKNSDLPWFQHPQHVLLGHYIEDDHEKGCLQTMCSLESGVLAGMNKAGHVLLWDLTKIVKTDDEDQDEDSDAEHDADHVKQILRNF